ncbi:hypothetical protein SCHPADRAFT_924298, partial [Schizopora paradoxa]
MSVSDGRGERGQPLSLVPSSPSLVEVRADLSYIYISCISRLSSVLWHELAILVIMSLPQPPHPSTSGPTTTPATDATIPTLDPHQETKPDYSKPEFADDRAYMASLHVPEDKIVEALSAMWDKAHGDRIKVWDEAIQKNSSTIGQPQTEVSGNPHAGPTGMTNGQQDVPPNTPTPRAVPIYSASASRSFSANQGSYPVDPMGPNKITYVVLDRSRPRPTDNLPPFANIVYVSMQTPGAYLPLFYLTAEGRRKADQKRLNTSATYDLATGRPHRPQELKEEECKRDAELTLDQIREAGVQFCDFVERNRWGGPDHEGEPDPVGLMFFDFFYNIDQHPFRNLTGDGEFGPQALALYAENTRKRWHMDINRGKPIYPIEEVKDDALKGCQDLLIKEERQQLLT